MQCERNTAYGQCSQEAIQGSRFCRKHDHHKGATSEIGQYRIANQKIRDTVERHKSRQDMKNLKDEIAIVRSTLEGRLNLIDSDAELAAAAPVIKEMALTLEKLISSCHTMDVKLGNLLDKKALISLAQEIIQIITKELKPHRATLSDEVVDLITESIGKEIINVIERKENAK